MRILDPTCSARSIWYHKNDPHVIHCDKRNEDIILSGDGRVHKIRPDVQCDFTLMPFVSSSFDMVVFDPPHLKDLKPKAWMAQKYGRLFPDWKDTIQSGFCESWRVLKEGGILIFKWCVGENDVTNNRYVSLKDVLELAPVSPLFGHTTGAKNHTRWITFVKFPDNDK